MIWTRSVWDSSRCRARCGPIVVSILVSEPLGGELVEPVSVAPDEYLPLNLDRLAIYVFRVVDQCRRTLVPGYCIQFHADELCDVPACSPKP